MEKSCYPSKTKKEVRECDVGQKLETAENEFHSRLTRSNTSTITTITSTVQ